jgi:DNA-binding Lrp family transcriptional regulator
MTIDEAIKELEEEGIMLGAGDYVDLEALKIAVDVMRDYQRVIYENERLRHENKLAFEQRDRLQRLIVENVALKVPTMNITITKEQADKLGFKFE